MRAFALVIAGSLVLTGCADSPPVGPTSPVASPASPTGAAGSPQQTQATGERSWSRIADIPTPRSEVAATTGGNAIYVIGGFGGSNVVERYVPGDARWERMPDLPTGVDHAMAAWIARASFPAGSGSSGGVYVFGGNSGGRPSARVFNLIDGANAWRELAPMPAPRAAGAAVAYWSMGHEALPVPPKIWVVGGFSERGLEPATFEYDPVEDRWTERANIPTPRDHLAAVHFQGRVCAIGGRILSMSRNLASFECFDAAANAWERLPAAPTPRGGVGATVVGRRLYFIGGEQPSGTFREVEIYDGRTRAWTRGPDLPEGKHGIGVAAFGSGVYVMTGGPTPGGSQTASAHVLEVPPAGAD